MEESKGSVAKRTIVRANKAQTVILKGAFTQSNVLSPEELKALSEKTGLSEKWIYLWFGRQRKKARNAPVDSGPVTSSSDPVPSPQEILEVKMEYRDSLVPKSSSPAVPVASAVGPASDGNVSQSEKAPPRKKARVSQPRAQRTKKNQTTVELNPIKIEYANPAVSTLGNSASAPSSMALSSNSRDGSRAPRLNEGPLAIQPAFCFPRIAPPSRTLVSANTLAHPHLEELQSGLSGNQPYRIYSPLSIRDATTVNVANSQPPPGIFKSSKAAVYQQGPRFHTHFYNNGPANYRNTRSNHETIPVFRSNHIPVPSRGTYLAESMFTMSDVSGRQNIPQQVGVGEYFSQSLAPAIVLENTSKPTPSVVVPMNSYSAYPSSSSVQYTGSSTVTESLPCAPYYFEREPNDVKLDPGDISAQYNLLMPRTEASPTFYNAVLDPSLAPLKHLTDILGGFRARDGTYAKLADLQEREGLIKCLLDDELERRSPFQAAMGLVLLSKLGLNW